MIEPKLDNKDLNELTANIGVTYVTLKRISTMLEDYPDNDELDNEILIRKIRKSLKTLTKTNEKV